MTMPVFRPIQSRYSRTLMAPEGIPDRHPS